MEIYFANCSKNHRRITILIYLLFIKVNMFSCKSNKIEILIRPNLFPRRDEVEFSLPQTYTTVYSIDNVVSFNASCRAPFPVQWNISDLSAPFMSYFVWKPMEMPENEIWIQYENNFERSKNNSSTFLNSETFGYRLACEKIGNYSIYEGIYLLRNTKIQPGKLLRKGYFPFSTDVYDFRKINISHYSTMVTKSGRNWFVGAYFDINKNYKIVHVFLKLIGPNPHLPRKINPLAIPTRLEVRIFSNESLSFSCFSFDGVPVNILVDDSFTLILSTKHNNRQNSLAKTFETGQPIGSICNFSATYSIRETSFATLNCKFSNGQKLVKGKAKCTQNSPDAYTNTCLLKEWHFEIVHLPVLQFDYNSSIVHCGSSQFILHVYECKNPLNCEFIQNQYAKGFYNFEEKLARSSISSMNQKNGTQFPMSDIPPMGVFVCQSGALGMKWGFIESFDKIRYINRNGIPKAELVQLTGPETAYIGDSTHFNCKAISTFFPYGPWFEAKFPNGSQFNFLNNNRTTNITLGNSMLGVFTLKLDTILPLDVLEVLCVTRWYESSEIYVTSHKIKFRQFIDDDDASWWWELGGVQYADPVELQANNKLEYALRNQTFTVGDENRHLSCYVSGDPKPTYTWLRNNSMATKTFPELYTSDDIEGGSFLVFPTIKTEHKAKYSGKFICLARNKFEESVVQFRVDIVDSPSFFQTQYAEIYIFLGIIGSILFIILAAALTYFIKKYKAAKKEIRNLSEAEVQEFFDGRKELVGTGINTEYLPFNKDFEIPFNDLEFSTSDRNMLGSGEFAIVVRGWIISKGKPVAIKISKPSTNVVYFKSMLSEVKIMSYIGNHENIAGIIGVCTEGIKTGSIYIATDICELGSLHSYLISSRSSFVDLLNANKEIDFNLKPPTTLDMQQLNTMDLISFASQIAKGMEYLTFKSVIHADLATRNVLVTSSKTAKISDFGLSKRLYENTNYVKKSQTPLPWRWMALESLQTLTFSSSSDVWSYGITLYEIFTLGDAPFPNENWSLEFVSRLESGMRMGRPKYSTNDIYSKIVTCWESDPKLRPDFGILRVFFEELGKNYLPLVACTDGKTLNPTPMESSVGIAFT